MDAVSSNRLRFGFVGGGIIAAVFIERLLASGSASAERIIATDSRDERLTLLSEQFGIAVTANNAVHQPHLPGKNYRCFEQVLVH